MAVNPWTALHPKDMLRPPSNPNPVVNVIHWRADWSLAVAYWDGSRSLLIRWNGDPGAHRGNPVSHSYPTWFVLPDGLIDSILSVVDSPNRDSAVAWLRGEEPSEWIDPVPPATGDF